MIFNKDDGSSYLDDTWTYIIGILSLVFISAIHAYLIMVVSFYAKLWKDFYDYVGDQP